jgi:transcriptional regulator with XRE-family HTH domain
MPHHPLGYEIRNFRTRGQFTFKELAYRVRCSAPYLWKIENGHQAPTAGEFLNRLAEALALSADERARLVQAANESQRVLRLHGHLDVEAYRLAYRFSNCLAKLDQEDLERIGEILSKTRLKEST